MGYDPWHASMADPFTPGHLNKIQSSMQVQRPTSQTATPMAIAEQPKSWMDKLYDEYRTQNQRDFDFQMDRWNQGRQLLGLADQGGNRVIPTPGTQYGADDQQFPRYGVDRNGNTVELSRDNQGPSYGIGPFPNLESQGQYGQAAEARVNQDAMRRGIFNTQAALNYANTSRSVAESDAAMRLAQFQFQRQADRAGRDERMMQNRLQWLEAPNTTGPDPDALMKLAAIFGQGTTDGLDPAAFSGGAPGGPMVMSPQSLGYGIPVNNGFATGGGGSYRAPTRAQNQATAARIRANQNAYRASLNSVNRPLIPDAVFRPQDVNGLATGRLMLA